MIPLLRRAAVTALLLTQVLATAHGADAAEFSSDLHASGRDVIEASFELAYERYYGQEVPWVTLARADHFADALAGAPLTAFGPLLFTDRDELPDRTGLLIEALLAEAGRVYVLGGASAVSDEVVEGLRDRGLDVVRLAGASRVETAVAVAEEVARLRQEMFGLGVEDVFVVRGFGTGGDDSSAWADSVAVGAQAAARFAPVVVSHSDHLSDPVHEFLATHATGPRWVVGGASALSDGVVGAAQGVRLAGSDRAATAAIVGDALSGAGEGDDVILVHGWSETGWASGLLAASILPTTRQVVDGSLQVETGRVLLAGPTMPEASVASFDDCEPGTERSYGRVSTSAEDWTGTFDWLADNMLVELDCGYLEWKAELERPKTQAEVDAFYADLHELQAACDRYRRDHPEAGCGCPGRDELEELGYL